MTAASNITVSFNVPTQNAAGDHLPVTFLAHGNAKGKTKPLTAKSTASLTGSVTVLEVKNGAGKWVKPPTGSDWAFQFTNVVHLSEDEPYLLTVHLVDENNNVGNGSTPVRVGE